MKTETIRRLAALLRACEEGAYIVLVPRRSFGDDVQGYARMIVNNGSSMEPADEITPGCLLRVEDVWTHFIALSDIDAFYIRSDAYDGPFVPDERALRTR